MPFPETVFLGVHNSKTRDLLQRFEKAVADKYTLPPGSKDMAQEKAQLKVRQFRAMLTRHLNELDPST